MNEYEALDEFGRWLISQVRDYAIEDWKMMIRGTMKGIDAEDLTRKLDSTSNPAESRKLLSELVPSIVDSALHGLLVALDEPGHPDLTVRGHTVSEVSDGLAGELPSEEGWVSRFSKYPRSD